jgi:AraC family transcriptional regulator
MQEPRLELLKGKQLIGMRREMSLTEDKTSELWRAFRPRAGEIEGRLNGQSISMQLYPSLQYFQQFNPDARFEKWAAVEVAAVTAVPAGMETFTLPGGLYAVFIHRGTPDTFYRTAQHIFGIWLPGSGYTLDHRPHFEILEEGYNPFDPASEEEVWVPVR